MDVGSDSWVSSGSRKSSLIVLKAKLKPTNRILAYVLGLLAYCVIAPGGQTESNVQVDQYQSLLPGMGLWSFTPVILTEECLKQREASGGDPNDGCLFCVTL